MPGATLEAFRDHGVARLCLSEDVPQAEATLVQLGRYGINLDAVGQQLLAAGLRQFEQAFANLLALLA